MLPALGLAPARGEHVLEFPRGRLAQLVAAGDPDVQALLEHFFVVGHVPFLLVAGLG
jgi:hypothetical protein